MSPIFGLSERTRMPRLGKIHLGVKVPNKTGQGEHPEAVDYFVLPPELHGIYGERPDSLEIVFPSDDTEIIAVCGVSRPNGAEPTAQPGAWYARATARRRAASLT